MSVGRESRNRYSVLMRIYDESGTLIEPEHLDIRPRVLRTKDLQFSEYVVNDGDNWSRIAWKKLGDGKRWWIIADYSGVVDAFSELNPRTENRFVTTLTVNVAAGACSALYVADTTKFLRGQRLLIEDLTPAAPVSFTAYVTRVNTVGGILEIQPTTAVNISDVSSRVSIVDVVQPKLVVPSQQDAFFKAMDFDNPKSTLVG